MPIDRGFGNAGSIWSGVPSDRRDWGGAVTGTVYYGGSAVGLNPDPAGPVLVVEGWRPAVLDPMTRVLCVRFAPDGHPAERGRWDGTLAVEAANATWVNALASSPAPAGRTAVLVANREFPFTLARTNYEIVEVGFSASTAGISAHLPVPQAAIQEGQGPPFSVRIVPDGSGYCVLSARRDIVRITTVPRTGTPTVATDVRLGGTGSALPGLYQLELASARLDGTWLSLALTAYLNHPGVGPVSVSALLRAGRNGARDSTFGDNGLWVSPLTVVYRHVVCAGEFPSGLAGVQGNQVVAFGIAPGGSGGDQLDDLFAVGGALQHNLGGALSSPVSADDGTHTYVFSRRANGAVVGCRFDRQGAADWGFGSAGIAMVDAAGELATPAALATTSAAGGQLMLATTRQVQGWDCDRIPVLTVLDATTGRPSPTFGAGGLALHSAVGMLAALDPDGSGWVTERRADYAPISGSRTVGSPTALRRLDADGRYVRTVQTFPPGVANAWIVSLLALDDGSVLVGGGGNPAWIAKLSAAGAFDPAFGTAGVAVPRPGVAGTVRVVGVRADGRIAIDYLPDLASAADPRAVALLHPDGSLDTSYAAADNGFRELVGVILLPSADRPDPIPVPSSATPFLEPDGTILLPVASSSSFENSPYVRFGLRRINPDGEYDPAFGIGVPSLAQALPGRLIMLSAPSGAGMSFRSKYSEVPPVGVARMGGKLYVVAAGVSGGVLTHVDTSPQYGLLVVMRWQADGSRDNTFHANGVQEVGYSPDLLDYSPRGVLVRSATELVVYGQAGRAETVTFSIPDGPTSTATVVRRPEPALFRVLDPTGVDMTFGQGGAELLPVQEFQAMLIAARLLPPARRRGGDRVRFVCTDSTSQPQIPRDPTTTFGGVGQFVLPRPLIGPVP